MSSTESALKQKQLEALGRVSPVIAHDINNLLSGILGYAQIILSDPSVDHLKPYIEEMTGAGKRIAALARILQVFNRQHSEFAEGLDLNAAIQEIEKFIPHIIGSGIHFAALKAPGLWRVRADPARIRRALFALALEVRDRIPNGGEFILKTGNLEVERNRVPETPQDPICHVCIEAHLAASLPGGLTASCLSDSVPGESLPSQENPHGIPEIDEMVRLYGGFLSMKNTTENELAIQICLPADLKTGQ
jgi:hypothetical protein